jgi:hypothetical protein
MEDWGPHYGVGADESPGLPSGGWRGCLIFFGVFSIFIAIIILTLLKAG